MKSKKYKSTKICNEKKGAIVFSNIVILRSSYDMKQGKTKNV